MSWVYFAIIPESAVLCLKNLFCQPGHYL